MAVFYDRPGFVLHRGDSLEVMQDLEPETFDLIFADPPYLLSNGGPSVHAGKRVKVDKAEWDKSHGPSADFAFHTSWIGLCHRLLKPTGTIWISGTYHSTFYCGTALLLQRFRILNDVIWFKSNAPANLGCRQLTHSHETLLWASKSKRAKYHFDYERAKLGEDWTYDPLKNPGKQMRDVWGGIGFPAKREKMFGKHPTQKPRKLLRRVLAVSSKPGFRLLDPFCGFSPAGLEAAMVGVDYVGIDLDPWSLERSVLLREHDQVHGIADLLEEKGAKGRSRQRAA